jgi:hypothetical protein
MYRQLRNFSEIECSLLSYCSQIQRDLLNMNFNRTFQLPTQSALEILPYSHWFQLRADLKMSFGPGNFHPSNVMQDVQRFLASVPSDYCGIAESYYALGLLYSLENDTDKAVALYLKGLEDADPSVRLPGINDGNHHSVKEL